MAYLVLYYVLAGAVLLLDVIVAVLIASAAQRKDRSFGSFFWLSFLSGLLFPLIGVLVPALVVAALPFRADDPRHPANKRTR